MINYLQVNEKKVLLRQDIEQSKNIFNVDSISLLIGENGTGKTHFFNRIIDSFKYSHANLFTDESISRINFFGIPERDNRNETRYWGVIYFSPVPFRSRIASSKNFIDASPSFDKALKFRELNDCKEIIDYFDIDPKASISYQFNKKGIIKSILGEIFKLKHKRIISILRQYPIHNEILELDRTLQNQDQENDNTEGLKRVQDERDYLLTEIITQIQNTLINQKSIFDLISFYITTNGLQKKSKISKAAMITIFDIFLNGEAPFNKNESKAIDLFIFEKLKVEKILKKFGKHIEHDDSMNFPVGAYFGEQLINEYNVQDYFELKPDDMSSGQLALISQLSILSDSIKKMSSKGFKKILLLVDEGDTYLHLEWQRKYIFKLNELLSKVKQKNDLHTLQVILATHSPLLATDVPKEFICTMDKIEAKSGFASPLHLLLNDSFGAKTIGEFASQKINSAVENIKNKKITAKDLYTIDVIDNEILKREIQKIMPNKDI